ncbi:hypothetical protein M0P65_06465 [Candidatus Gracilibacteria bacterium]|jgi:hypothetical protein|nr:hypothetical protein [Candidatus Gracilibacteria bacterium]
MAIDKNININYLNKDFSSLRSFLISLCRTYYKDTISDFSPNDPATAFIDMTSAVGDILSYYEDVNIKENLFLLAEERKNIIPMAQAFGYKPRAIFPAITNLDVYQLIPSIGTGAAIRPDYNYALKIASGMKVGSDTGVIFRTNTELDFSFSSSFDSTTATIYQVDSTGAPTYYLLKKQIKIESGDQKTVTVTFNEPVRYSKILLNDTNIISVDSVVDSDGNNWYEVPYLAQDSIFTAAENTIDNSQTLYNLRDQTPYLLKNQRVPKRFITRYRTDGKIEMQFGSGVETATDEEIIPNPDNVGMMTPTGMSKLNYSWALSNFLFSNAYGQVPHNTTLTIKYTIGGGISANVLPKSITNIIEVQYNIDETSLDQTLLSTVKNSLACSNPDPATGGRDAETIEEIKYNALAYFAAQDRAVSETDYILRSLSMPAKFGSIAKSYITQDDQLVPLTDEKKRNPLALNLYILSYDANKKLVKANAAIKENLKTYIDKYRIITDSISIRDAYIINIGVDFEITALSYFSAKEVLLNCMTKLKEFFNIDRWQIRQPIVISDIFRLLAGTEGVQNIIDVTVKNLFDTTLGYSGNIYNINAATYDGIIYPSLDPSIWEIRFPDGDIRGRVKAY